VLIHVQIYSVKKGRDTIHMIVEVHSRRTGTREKKVEHKGIRAINTVETTTTEQERKHTDKQKHNKNREVSQQANNNASSVHSELKYVLTVFSNLI
jgi:hypothetical protein